jgi:hypothetical protein
MTHTLEDLSSEEWVALRHIWAGRPARQREEQSVMKRLIAQDLVRDQSGRLAVTDSGRRTIVYGCPSHWSNAL